MFGVRMDGCIQVSSNPWIPEWTDEVTHWYLTLASSNGAAPMTVYWSKGTCLGTNPPSVFDVLESLQAEMVLDGTTFEEWCTEFGYNSDSISHRRKYRKAIANTEHLYALMGEDQWEIFLQIEW